MQAARQAPSSAEVATEVNGLLAGLGILTMTLFPFALPGLFLLVVAPVLLVAVAGLLVAIPVLLPLWVARMVIRSRARRSRRSAGTRATTYSSRPGRLVA